MSKKGQTVNQDLKVPSPPKINVSQETRDRFLKKEILVVGKSATAVFQVMGYLASLQANNLYGNFKWVAGGYTSSIVAIMAALRLNFYDIYVGLQKIFPFSFLDTTDINFLEYFRKGYIDDSVLGRSRFFRFLIREGIGREDVSLQGLYEITGINLVLVISDYNNGTFYYLSRFYNGNMPLLEAALITNNYSSYHKPVKAELPPFRIPRYYVDGNSSASFPLNAFLKSCSRFWLGYYVPKEFKDQVPQATPDNYLGIRYNGDTAPTYGQTLGLSKYRYGRYINFTKNNGILDLYDQILTVTSNGQDTSLVPSLEGQTLIVDKLQQWGIPSVFRLDNTLPPFTQGMNFAKEYVEKYEMAGGEFVYEVTEPDEQVPDFDSVKN